VGAIVVAAVGGTVGINVGTGVAVVSVGDPVGWMVVGNSVVIEGEAVDVV
jgi:hypothetical protein